MYILILIVLFFVGIFGGYITRRFWDTWNDIGLALEFCGLFLCVVSIGVSIFIGVKIFNSINQLCEIPIIEQKIIVYQDENKKIEEEIHTIVENYKDYESGIFDKNASVSTIVNLYPELKSDSLVKQQIDVYQKK